MINRIATWFIPKTVRSYSRLAICVCAVSVIALSTTAAHASGTCGPVREAYNNMMSSHAAQTIKNSGKVNVTEALGKITESGQYSDTCKLLREEALDGVATTVYSEEMKSKDGDTVATVWISKNTNTILKQDAEADMGADGKGRQIITFTYKK